MTEMAVLPSYPFPSPSVMLPSSSQAARIAEMESPLLQASSSMLSPSLSRMASERLPRLAAASHQEPNTGLVNGARRGGHGDDIYAGLGCFCRRLQGDRDGYEAVEVIVFQ